MARDVPGGAVPAVVIRKRVHEANLSSANGPAELVQQIPRLLKRTLDERRRRAGGAPSEAA